MALRTATILNTLRLARGESLQRRHLVHGVPYFVHTIFLLSFNALKFDVPGWLWSLIVLCILIHMLVYAAAALRLLQHHKRNAEQNYSNIDSVGLAWLSKLVIGFIILFAADFIFVLDAVTGRFWTECPCAWVGMEMSGYGWKI